MGLSRYTVITLIDRVEKLIEIKNIDAFSHRLVRSSKCSDHARRNFIQLLKSFFVFTYLTVLVVFTYRHPFIR